jgi:hypothetical protein
MSFDASILGIDSETLAEMDEEERKAFLADSLNQAADLLQVLTKVFAKDLGGSKADVSKAALTLINVARA